MDPSASINDGREDTGRHYPFVLAWKRGMNDCADIDQVPLVAPSSVTH